MSNDAISWAWRARVGSAKLVLVALADHGTDHSGEDWVCFPSVGRLVERTELGRATIERHLRFLDAEGYISRRRRVRPDGRLGIFDYTLHREPETRAQLKAERAAAKAGDAADPPDDPALKMSGGKGADPALVLDAASAQNDVDPPLKTSALEPSVEPLPNPHQAGAREPGDQGFEELAELWPDSGRKRTNWGQARAAFARACGLETAERLVAAGRACAVDPDIAGGDFGWPGLHSWLSEERWRGFLPRPPPAGSGALEATPFAGPAEVARLFSPGELASYFAGWRPADRVLLTRTTTALQRVAERIGRQRLAELQLRVERVTHHGD